MSLLEYKYKARDPATGKKVSAEVQADSVTSAAKLIKERGLSPLEITLKVDSNKNLLGFITNRIPAKDKVLFSRQLSTLINAGLPLVQSLRTVMGQTKNSALKGILTKVITDVESGESFASSLKKHPKIFSTVFTSLVEAGEASGTLDKSLDRLAFQQEKDAEVLSKVRGAMVYPLIVLLVMAGVVGFMLVSVLPQVKELYRGFGDQQLPALTRALLALSDFIIKYWWGVLIIIVALGFFGFRWTHTLGGKTLVDKLKMKMPPIAPLFMKLYMARFARTSTTLVGSGVPLLQVLEITSQAVDNVHISNSIHKAMEKVKGGTSLSEAISNDSNFLELVPNMLRIGEQSGEIEQMLSKTADYYEKEVDVQIKTISTIIEPLLMVVLGVVAIIIVSAILGPIYSLVGKNVIR